MSETQAQVEILDKPAPLTAFDPIEAGLTALRDEAAKTVFDVTTTAGDKAAREFRKRCVTTRTAASEAYESWNKPILAMQAAAREKRDYILTEVKAIEGPIDEQIKAEEKRRDEIKAAKEAAELARQQAIQARINTLGQFAAKAVGKSSTDILALRDELADMPITTELFEHRTGEATVLHAQTSATLEDLYNAALAQEQEQARLAAERARLEQERKEQEALAKAAREAEEARMAAERAKLAEEQAALKAATEAEAARQEAARAEQRRQEEAAAAAARQREEEAAAALRAQQEKLDRERREFEEQQAAARRAEEEARAKAAREAEEKRVAAQEAEARAQREKEEAERLERERAEQERLAEAARREQEQFVQNGPGDVEIVQTLADHYDVNVGDVMGWMKKFDYTATDEALAAANGSH
ncbi:hypothetical protein [Bordetella genomosp. 11]|uniref:Uncharacterized protein n=1 Tax=Bordetella genomosp. 11 TaxID=1416808 RepID=A0A261UGA6_9BORD|nr:hypothetical protein [Bordetella genomosp. 11]OZI59913.1 hypothetical protein CAL28_10515 [Bordetella genomosp. 11]